MDNKKLSIHTKAVNLARRWTVQNENDLVQEDMFGNNMNIGGHREYDHDYCRELSQHLVHGRDLPTECMKFQDVFTELKRRETDTTHYSQILS